MREEEVASFDVAEMVTEEEGAGFILEVSVCGPLYITNKCVIFISLSPQVTLRYPESLHLAHNSFPLAPEQVEITEVDLSPYSTRCLHKLSQKKVYKATKLTATFKDRVRYLCHGLNLKLYLSLGMELVELHRGITFRQTRFLEPYIAMCTRKRASARTKSEGNLMKLLCNSLYGKMIEGVSNRMDCRFNYGDVKAVERFSDPLFKGFLICGEDFSVSFHQKKSVQMKQSWAVGFAILELSKYVMQDLLYNILKPRFCGELSVLMSDTDSWVFVAPAPSPDEIVYKIRDVMDFSNYSEKSVLFNPSRKNQLGFLKNEVSRDTITKFAGLRSKTYAFVTASNLTENRAKGVKKVYKKKIKFEDYTKCLESMSALSVRQVCIQSKDHVNMIIESTKIAFSSFDDKRFLMCPIHSTPYGSYLIREYMMRLEAGSKIACFFCANPNILV